MIGRSRGPTLLWGALALSLVSPCTASDWPVAVGTARGAPGQTVRGSLPVGEDADGSSVTLPLSIVTGSRPGPAVWIDASAHGDEYGGPRALQEIVNALDPSRMSGTVVAVMIANPPAFRGLQRVNPSLDDLADMGDVFPGRERFATERIAAAVTDNVRRTADYFVDLHTGGDRFRQCPFVFYSLTGGVAADRYDELARAFGVAMLWRDTDRVFANDAVTRFSEAGVPSFLLEVGGGQPLDAADLRLQADAVRSFLRSVGILPGPPSRLRSHTVVGGYRIVTNGRGGFFDAAVKPCDRIHEGTVLGTIRDVYGDVVETLKAPAGADIVLGVSTYPAAPTGGWLLELGVGLREAPASVTAALPQPAPVPATAPAQPTGEASVPGTSPSADAATFPGRADAPDPTGRFVIASTTQAGGSNALTLRRLPSGDPAVLMSYGRTASVLWAPDGNAVAIASRARSGPSTLAVYFPERPGERVEMGAELDRSYPRLGERSNEHVSFETVRWLNPKTLRFRLRGYGTHDPEGFDDLFDYTLGGRVRRATGLPAK